MKWKKGIALGLAVMLTLGMTACDSATGDNESNHVLQGTQITVNDTEAQAQLDLSYQAKFTSFASKEDGISNVKIEGDKIYEIAVQDGNAGVLMEQSISAGGVGDRRQIMKFDVKGSIMAFYVDASENLYMIVEDSQNTVDEDGTANTKRFRLQKCDANGNLVYEQAIDPGDMEYFYPFSLVADGKGRTYVPAMDAILRFDEEGHQKKAYTISNGSFGGICINQDDNLYCAAVKYDADSSCELLEYAFESDEPIGTHKNFISAESDIVQAGDLLYAISSGSFCAYSIKSEGIINRVTLMNCGIDTSSVVSVGVVGEEYYIAQSEVSFEMGTKVNQAKKYELACIGKADPSQAQQKQVITLGAPMIGSALQDRIIELNKRSDKYRVVVQSYYSEAEGYREDGMEEAIKRFQMDVMTGKGPDIVQLSHVNPALFYEKGVLEDLYPWLEKSSSISRDFFVDGVLDKMDYKGKLYGIMDGFSLETMIGKTDIVGGKSGWSISDLLAVAKAHPNMKLITGFTKSMFLEAMLTANTDQYIDFATGACHFDSSEFKAVLELARNLEDEIQYGGMVNDGTAAGMHNNMILLCSETILHFGDYAQTDMIYGEPEFTRVGYPSGKGNGCLLKGSGEIGISAYSTNKEAAWAFIEDYIKLLDEEETTYSFPVTRGKYEKAKAYASEVHYMTDENGEVILDRNGNPIKRPSGPVAITDGGMVDTDPLTEQQASKIANMIKDSISVYDIMDDEIFKIIEEEAQSYFAGAKSVDEVADIIQKRVSLYVQEN